MSDSPLLTETVTLSEAQTLMRCLAAEHSLLLLSPPGVGKSDSVAQAARQAGLECRSLLGTQIAPEDVSGIPRIVGERSVFCPPRVLLPERPEPFCLFLAVSAQPPEKVKLAEMEVWPILSESRVRKMASVRNLLSSLSYTPSGA